MMYLGHLNQNTVIRLWQVVIYWSEANEPTIKSFDLSFACIFIRLHSVLSYKAQANANINLNCVGYSIPLTVYIASLYIHSNYTMRSSMKRVAFYLNVSVYIRPNRLYEIAAL